MAGSLLIVWRWPTPAQPVVDQIAQSIMTGIFFMLGTSFLLWWQYTFALELSDDVITMRGILFTRTVRKGEVKNVVEKRRRLLAPPGVRILKYGVGAWFWGGIWVPKALPEYEEIRNTALSWQRSVR